MESSKNYNMLLKDIKVGDKLIRLLGGSVVMRVIVGSVNEKTIKCGSADGFVPWEDGWTFNRENGAEIDEDLGWDGITITGSYIKL